MLGIHHRLEDNDAARRRRRDRSNELGLGAEPLLLQSGRRIDHLDRTGEREERLGSDRAGADPGQYRSLFTARAAGRGESRQEKGQE